MTQGITPAYAGKSTTPVQIARGMWDHPRLCGEKRIPFFNFCSHSGITPAYAGKSAGDQSGRRGNQDHPRLCGEKFFLTYLLL